MPLFRVTVVALAQDFSFVVHKGAVHHIAEAGTHLRQQIASLIVATVPSSFQCFYHHHHHHHHHHPPPQQQQQQQQQQQHYLHIFTFISNLLHKHVLAESMYKYHHHPCDAR